MNYEQMSFFLVTFVTVLYICQLIISIILYATNPFFSKVQKGVPEGRREERRVEESGSSMLSEDRSLGFSGAGSAVLEAPGAEALREQGFTTAGLCEKYIALKSNIKHSTLDNYRYALDIIRTDEIAELPAVSLCPSDAKSFLGRLQASGRSYSAILSARSVLKQSYGSAVEDGLLKRNPFDFPVSEAVVNTSGKRQALTREQRDSFLKFVRDTKGLSANYDTFYILFHTGLRVSELCGLTLSDIDLKARSVKVSHQLQRTRDMRYIVETTKTESGARVLPVSKEVAKAFERIIKARKKPGSEPEIDGFKGFLFLDRNDMPFIAQHIEKRMSLAHKRYNEAHKTPLPTLTPHVCRHTYCSLMAVAGVAPKTLQYLMGHSQIGVTMNVYTHIKFEDVKKEIERLEVS